MANLLGNLSVLDNLIAIVIVMLVLSLIVQSIQAVIKKLLQVKSLQMEQAVVHLFHYVLNEDATAFMNTWLNRLPMTRAILSLFKKKAPYLSASPNIQALFLAVEKELIKAGRVTMGGKVALDSVPKDDLLKFLGNIPLGEITALFPQQNREKLAELAKQLTAAQQSLADFMTDHGAVIEKTPLAKIQEPLTEMLAHAGDLFNSGLSQVRLGDMAKLGGMEVGDAQKLLTALPASMQQSISHLQDKAQKDAQAALQKLSLAMKPVQEGLQAILWLPEQMSQILAKADSWYGTIMQSLEDRYARSMKTCALVISIVVVIALNANLFGVYRQISGDQAMRDLIVQSGESILQKSRDQQNAGQLPQQQQTTDQLADLSQSIEQVKQASSLYTDFGFSGPKWMVDAWNTRDKITRYQVLETLLGWIVMTALLSVGAPFWQDVLESLFGLKNFLRKQPTDQKQSQ
ncbi:MAG: hypothetical protein JST85_29670 [Acidobacteria bacterium]|nr:hypothetical protein [Acidobacteriota bacterium]